MLDTWYLLRRQWNTRVMSTHRHIDLYNCQWFTPAPSPCWDKLVGPVFITRDILCPPSLCCPQQESIIHTGGGPNRWLMLSITGKAGGTWAHLWLSSEIVGVEIRGGAATGEEGPLQEAQEKGLKKCVLLGGRVFVCVCVWGQAVTLQENLLD